MHKTLKWTALALAVILVAGTPAIVGIRPFIGPKARPLTDRRFEPSQARRDRGKYLVTSGLAPCAMCHSPWDTTGGGLAVVAGRELTAGTGRRTARRSSPRRT